MFEPGSARVFGLPPGCDFGAEFLNGLHQRLTGQPPEALARVQIWVNNQRTKRHLTGLYQKGPPRLLPRIRVITDIGSDPMIAPGIPLGVNPLRRRFELAQLVSALLDKEADLAPRSAIFDLADSLAGLMDEMHGEGVSVDQVLSLDLAEAFSEYWKRSLAFLNILAPYFADSSEPDTETRQRLAIESLTRQWAENPPVDPVLVAGSTGSRGTTALFMQAVSKLPQGAIVLPGFDFDLPAEVWENLKQPQFSADHPQAVLAKLVEALQAPPQSVANWSGAVPENPARNRLMSLALRPAPVTDQWMIEGPRLRDIPEATNRVALMEAPSQREEAVAIAVCLRAAAQQGKKATLISPDRGLTRQVTAALQRWNILPDDSAGRPLPLTPPGVFLRLVAGLIGQRLTSENLLILLKHPLTHSGGGRGRHLLWTRELELNHLRGGSPFVAFDQMLYWAGKQKKSQHIIIWINWLRSIVEALSEHKSSALSDFVTQTRQAAEALSRGSRLDASDGELWLKDAGKKALETFENLAETADAAGNVTASEYHAILRSVLNRAEVRDATTPHPLISIWGTIEARISDADIVVLGGLNEGVWPNIPAPDPWLNRNMRMSAGLLLPERRIGLAAHDFTQAVAAPEVLLTRSLRQGDAPSVASRWLIRLTNLMSGIGEEGETGLKDMRHRGQKWLSLAAKLEEPDGPLPAEPRPAAMVPSTLHPRKLSVTRIKVLIRDPYAIYAQYILRLSKLDPLRREPDALIRGQAIHAVLHEFVASTLQELPPDAAQRLMEIAARIFAKDVPWPANRRLWLARLGRVADRFVQTEMQRRQRALPISFEVKGGRPLAAPDFLLTGTADRIDRAPDGSLIIYDYKSGTIPTKAQIKEFDKQLPLEAAIAESGGFQDVPAGPVSGLEYVGLGGDAKIQAVEMSEDLIEETWAGLARLIAAYRSGKTGYGSRTRIERRSDTGDYDHLARFGEWEDSDAPQPVDLT